MLLLFLISLLTLICCQLPSSFRATYVEGGRAGPSRATHVEVGSQKTPCCLSFVHGELPVLLRLSPLYYPSQPHHPVFKHTFLLTEVKPGRHFTFPKYFLFSHQTRLKVFAGETVLLFSLQFSRSCCSAPLPFRCREDFSPGRSSNSPKVKQ